MLCVIPIVKAVSGLEFSFSIYSTIPPSSVEGLPPGLSYSYSSSSNTLTISGVPYTVGVFPVVITFDEEVGDITFVIQVGLEYG
jgi:hypothetical protein